MRTYFPPPFLFSLLTLFSLHSPMALAGNSVREIVPETSFTIEAPKGWTERREHRGQSLIFEDRRKAGRPKKAGDILFTPNLTVALMHKPQPIDAFQIDVLNEKLVKEFGAAAGVENYRIIESRFVDYRGTADAILVYADFSMNGIPMNQMHVLISGSQESALLTYTQLEAEFGGEQLMDEVWRSMMSAELRGNAPFRYAGPLQAGAFASVLTLFSSLLHLLRRRRQKRVFRAAERSMDYDYDDEFERSSWSGSELTATRVAAANPVAS